MTGKPERVRELISVSLLLLLGVLTVGLWTLDISAMQSAFSALLGADLMAFSLMGYVYLKPTYGQVKVGWFIAGCAFLAALLVIALWAEG